MARHHHHELRRLHHHELLAVFAGGVVGALARVGLLEAWPPETARWPWATFAVNVAGALVVGVLAVRFAHAARGVGFRLLGSGFCGALTTFSTMQVELVRMLQADRLALAAGYAAASLAAGMAAVALGRRLA